MVLYLECGLSGCHTMIITC